MHLIRKTVLAAACCLFVSGCSTMMEDVEAYLFDEDEAGDTVYYAGDPAIDMNYSDMAREMSGGSVQVFGLDDAAPAPAYAGAPLTPLAPDYHDGGIPYSADPNVTVYPLSGEPVYSHPQRPALVPPSQHRSLSSPFGGPLQSPAPLEYPERESFPSQPSLSQGRPYVRPQTFLRLPVAPGPDTRVASSQIYFKHGSSALNRSGEEIIDYVSQNPEGVIVVEGHASQRTETTDPVKSSIVNLKESMDRAFHVSRELLREGVPIEMIETRAYGDARPARPVDGLDQEAASRRVEITTALPGPVTTSRVGMPYAEPDAPIPPLARY